MRLNREQLKEAQKLFETLDWLDKHLAYELSVGKAPQFTVNVGKGSETFVYISKEIAARAFEMQRSEWIARRSAIIRRLNQLDIAHEATTHAA